jgi:hypothetical protein
MHTRENSTVDPYLPGCRCGRPAAGLKVGEELGLEVLEHTRVERAVEDHVVGGAEGGAVAVVWVLEYDPRGRSRGGQVGSGGGEVEEVEEEEEREEVHGDVRGIY